MRARLVTLLFALPVGISLAGLGCKAPPPEPPLLASAPAQPGPLVPPRLESPSCIGAEYPLTTLGLSPYAKLSASDGQTTKTGFFLLDTGARVSAIDDEWSRGFATPAQGKVKLAELTFGYEQHDVTFLAQPLHTFDPVVGTRDGGDAQLQIGTLGTDFLSEFALDFHFDPSHKSGSVRLSRADAEGACSADWAPLTAVPLVLYSSTWDPNGTNIPTVVVDVGEATNLKCQLDTGTNVFAPQSWISVNEAAKKAIGAGLTKVRDETILVTGGTATVQVYQRADGKPVTVRIGALTLGVDLVKVQANGFPYTSPEPYALAGMPVIGKWEHVVIDPFAKLLRVK
jgi:hypothetical protein